MADTKISAELSAGRLDGSELTEIVQAGNNRKTTTQDIANLAAPTANQISGLAAVATSGSASDLSIGTIPNGRLSAVPNSALSNSSMTIAGHPISLGGSQTLAASDLTNTTIGSGPVLLATSPTIASPAVTGSLTGTGGVWTAVIGNNGNITNGGGSFTNTLSTNPFWAPWQGGALNPGLSVIRNYTDSISGQLDTAISGTAYSMGTSGGAGVTANAVAMGPGSTVQGINTLVTIAPSSGNAAAAGNETMVFLAGGGEPGFAIGFISEFADDGNVHGPCSSYWLTRNQTIQANAPTYIWEIVGPGGPWTATIQTTGSVMGISGGAVSAAYGIDLRNAAFSGYAFASPDFFVDGAGNISGTTLTLNSGTPDAALSVTGSGNPNMRIVGSGKSWLWQAFGTSMRFYNATDNMDALDIAPNGLVTVNNDLTVVGSAVILSGLPTSNPHVVDQLWNNSGVLTVSAG